MSALKIFLLSSFFLSLSEAHALTWTATQLKDFEAKYSKGLPPKSQGTEQVWDTALGLAAQFKSAKITTWILQHDPESGIQTAWYRYDLMKLLETNGPQTLEEASKLNKDKNCLLHWLIPENKLVEKDTVLKALQKIPGPHSQAYQKAVEAKKSGVYPRSNACK
jgi:hypothetical protein